MLKWPIRIVFFGWTSLSKEDLSKKQPTPLRHVKKCRNLGQTLEFRKDFGYKPNQPGPNNSQIIAFLESKFLNNKS